MVLKLDSGVRLTDCTWKCRGQLRGVGLEELSFTNQHGLGAQDKYLILTMFVEKWVWNNKNRSPMNQNIVGTQQAC